MVIPVYILTICVRVPFSHYPLQHLFIDFLKKLSYALFFAVFLPGLSIFIYLLSSGISFLLHNLLFWFRNNVFFQLASSQCGREGSLCGFQSDHESLSPVLPPGVFVHLNVLNDHRIYIFALSSSTLCISEHVQ